MKKAAIALYLLAVHAALAVAVVNPDAVRHVLGKPNPMIERTHFVHTQADRVAPEDAAVFLGDSITQRLPAATVADRAINYGIGSQTTTDLARHAADYRALDTARVVYLLIGINDLAQGKFPDFAGVLAEIPQGVPLVWTGVMHADGIAGIEAANAAARGLCAERPGCTFVEPPIASGDLEDGVHLTADGYRKWIGALRVATPPAPGRA